MGEPGKDSAAIEPREFLLQALIEQQENAVRAIVEAKKKYGLATAQVMMEQLFQHGVALYRQVSFADREVEYVGKPAMLRILDVQIGNKLSDKDNIRFIICDTNKPNTHRADVSFERGAGGWVGHEVLDVEMDSDMYGTIVASGLKLAE